MAVKLKQQTSFLASLANGSSVKKACEAAGVGRRTVYDWRENDEEFAEAWEDAQAGSIEILEDEVRERALDRADKNSHLLLMFLLKKLKPEYRDNHKTEVNITSERVREFEFTKEEVAEGLAILQEYANKS